MEKIMHSPATVAPELQRHGECDENTVHYEPIARSHSGGAPFHPVQSSISRHTSKSITGSHKELRDAQLDVNLPYRTLTNEANLDEYRIETSTGQIPAASDIQHNYKLITFVEHDPENPKNWSKTYKWYCTMVVAITCFVVAFASSVITADIVGVMEEFGASEEVALLSITVFVMGFGIGKNDLLLDSDWRKLTR